MRPSSGTADSWRIEFGDSLADRKVLVTGASGFIGSHLCRALTALGAGVHPVSRSGSLDGVPPGVRSGAVDLTDARAIESELSRVRPDLIYHLAGLVTGEQGIELVLPTLWANLVGTVHLFLAAHETGCRRVVVVGSSEEPGASPRHIATSPYGAAKGAASIYASMFRRLYQLPVVLVRPFLAYGPAQASTKLIPYTILALLNGKSPRIRSGQRVCDFVYVEDVVRGLLWAGLREQADGEQPIELGSGQGTSIREAVESLVVLTNSTARLEFEVEPGRLEERPAVARLEAARARLGWEPRWSLRDGLAQTVAWYRERNS